MAKLCALKKGMSVERCSNPHLKMDLKVVEPFQGLPSGYLLKSSSKSVTN